MKVVYQALAIYAASNHLDVFGFGLHKADWITLIRIQNTTGTKVHDHTASTGLHPWFSVHFRIEFKIMLVVFMVLNELAPSYPVKRLNLHTLVESAEVDKRCI